MDNELKIWSVNVISGVATSDDGEKRSANGQRWVTETDAVRMHDELKRLRETLRNMERNENII